MSFIRKLWTQNSPERKECLLNARVKHYPLTKSGTLSKSYVNRYKCADCDNLFVKIDVQVDHIAPVGKLPDWPPTEVRTWNRWLVRLWCPVSNLQILCLTCHKKKSKEEDHDV